MRQFAGQTAKNLAAPASLRHALAIFQCRNRTMSSLPPVGGTTRRSLFAVWTAAVVLLANRHLTEPTRFARSQVFNVIVDGRRQPLSSSVNRLPAWRTALRKFGNCASAALWQAAA
jgi:hypothetical protein